MKANDPAFRDLMMDHYKGPRFCQKPEHFLFDAEEHNRTCGDQVHLYLVQEKDQLYSLRFQGVGCSLSMASASLLCEKLQHFSLGALREMWQAFELSYEQGQAFDASPVWQALEALKEYPVRSRCVKLPWQAYQRILQDLEGNQA